MGKPKVIAIVGPTSSGKTSLSIEIAKRFNGEVISADSRQVYVGMDVGTGKVTLEETQNVPHHLLDIVHPNEVYTAADFKRDATVAILDIQNRHRLPIIAGGTFFYLDILRGKMSVAPVEPNAELRERLEKIPTEKLFSMLREKDARRAELIDKHNRRRLIRSLEIIEELGSVPQVVPSKPIYEILVLGIELDKDTLHKNIHSRLDARFASGMIGEVRRLHAEGISYDRLEGFGLEYRYIAKFLQGAMSEKEMREELEIKIRQFAKRQMTWLKRDKEIEWFSPDNNGLILNRVVEFLT